MKKWLILMIITLMFPWAGLFAQAADVTISPNGNLGIGTSTPRASLDVVSNGGNYAILANQGRIGEVAEPVLPDDAATKEYVDATLLASPLLQTVGLDTVICINSGGGSHQLTFTNGLLTGYVENDHHCGWGEEK